MQALAGSPERPCHELAEVRKAGAALIGAEPRILHTKKKPSGKLPLEKRFMGHPRRAGTMQAGWR